MYLFARPDAFRDVNGGDDAAIVYHEYTHGLSNRLVTDADGAGALNSPQAGAMGEAWSDWYAHGLPRRRSARALDTAARRRGRHGRLHRPRQHRRSAPSRSTARSAPTAPPAPAAGAGHRRLHLRRLRPGLRRRRRSTPTARSGRRRCGTCAPRWGPQARALVTPGMRLPPEPTFLERATRSCSPTALFEGADAEGSGASSRGRGMGFFAAAAGGDDTARAENFALPPAADAPRGTISGQVTNALGGAGVAGVTVGLAGG